MSDAEVDVQPETLPDLLLSAARRGVDFRKELADSAVLKYVLWKAQEAAEEAGILLAEANASNIEEVRRLQNEVRRALDLKQWIESVIDEGDAALSKLQDEYSE